MSEEWEILEESITDIFSHFYESMTDNNMVKLKPCPFCGSPGMFGSNRNRGHRQFRALCADIDGCKCPVVPQTLLYSTMEEAAAAWNKRAETPAKES
jgi:hypothetical protein